MRWELTVDWLNRIVEYRPMDSEASAFHRHLMIGWLPKSERNWMGRHVTRSEFEALGIEVFRYLTKQLREFRPGVDIRWTPTARALPGVPVDDLALDEENVRHWRAANVLSLRFAAKQGLPFSR